MQSNSRRDFLKLLGAASTALLFGGRGLAELALDGEKLNFLIVGDSLIWGQGLEEKDKSYTLIAEWLRNGAFGSPRTVDLKVKAHSGASLTFHPENAAAFKRANREETYPYNPEVNVGFPSIWKQIEVAADEYKASGNPQGADIIMLTGGLTDISVAKLLDPFGDDKLLPPMIERYCRDDMADVLEHAAKLHPRAAIAVVGYFPMISAKTPSDKLFNGWLESMSVPLALKPFANNPLTRAVYFNKIKRKVLGRTQIWLEQSDKNLRLAVDRLNAKFERPRAVFIPTPITADQSLDTPNTLLFKLGKHGRSEDPIYEQRKAACRSELPELKRSTGLDYPVRYCEIAGIGHPNPAGARAYAEAIKPAIARLIR